MCDAILQCEREGVWMVQNLREQTLLLEIVLLYHKDYKHSPLDLLQTIKTLQVPMYNVCFMLECT